MHLVLNIYNSKKVKELRIKQGHHELLQDCYVKSHSSGYINKSHTETSFSGNEGLDMSPWIIILIHLIRQSCKGL